MRVMAIGVKSEKEGQKEFEEAFEAARKGLPFRPKTGAYFTSLEAARNFLTPKRMELLHVIKKKNPHSLYELAKYTRRGFSSVLRDISLLTKHGLVKLTKTASSQRNAVYPTVDYDAINLWIGI